MVLKVCSLPRRLRVQARLCEDHFQQLPVQSLMPAKDTDTPLTLRARARTWAMSEGHVTTVKLSTVPVSAPESGLPSSQDAAGSVTPGMCAGGTGASGSQLGDVSGGLGGVGQ